MRLSPLGGKGSNQRRPYLADRSDLAEPLYDRGNRCKAWLSRCFPHRVSRTRSSSLESLTSSLGFPTSSLPSTGGKSRKAQRSRRSQMRLSAPSAHESYGSANRRGPHTTYSVARQKKSANSKEFVGAPYGNRTRVSALRGPRPRPLDEGSNRLGCPASPFLLPLQLHRRKSPLHPATRLQCGEHDR